MLLFYVLGGAAFLLSLAVRKKLTSTYEHWSQVANSWRLTGAQVARRILDANQLANVRVERSEGHLSDHYDPRPRIIRLSPRIYQTPSVAAMAIASHECGHALQDADNYFPLKIRTGLAPLANVGARFGIPLAIFGSFFGMPLAVQVGMLGYVGSLLLFFLTLPVEFNASRRALDQLQELGLAQGEQEDGARQMLRAAAMTYVAGVASAAVYIVYLALAGGRAFLRRPKPPAP